MTLVEFTLALREYSKIQSGKPETMSDAKFEAGLEKLRALNLPDMKV